MKLSQKWFNFKLLSLKMVCGVSLPWKSPSESFGPSPSSRQETQFFEEIWRCRTTLFSFYRILKQNNFGSISDSPKQTKSSPIRSHSNICPKKQAWIPVWCREAGRQHKDHHCQELGALGSAHSQGSSTSPAPLLSLRSSFLPNLLSDQSSPPDLNTLQIHIVFYLWKYLHGVLSR